MSSSLVAEFVEGPLKWLKSIVARIIDCRLERRFANNEADLSPTETALLVTHVGLSHVYGIADSDTAVQDYLPEQVVVTLNSEPWRVGHFPAAHAPSFENLWACLYRLGLDTETARVEVAKAL
ncbi:hypothetical protein StoSoilB13_04470 [Arthrobacter sp. StoSoilB13]|nr:hypothetical protein StoSoilB13_04470 [Arthrobacter sp. StoSoilB13]